MNKIIISALGGLVTMGAAAMPLVRQIDTPMSARALVGTAQTSYTLSPLMLNISGVSRTARRAPLKLQSDALDNIYLHAACAGYGVSAGMYCLASEWSDYTLLGSVELPAYGGVEQDGIYYCVTATQLLQYDSQTWELLTADYLPDVSVMSTCMSLDPTTGRTYGCFFNIDSGAVRYEFGYVDFKNIEANGFKRKVTLAEIGAMSWNAIACDAQGRVFAIDSEGNLLRMDKETGAQTIIGKLPIKPGAVSSAAIEPRSGRMFYALAAEPFGIYEIDTTTAEATLVGDFDGRQVEVFGMYAGKAPVVSESPAPAENLVADFKDGSLTGTVSFDIPARLTDGTPAEGEVKYSILLNDKEVTSGKEEYGIRCAVPLTVEAPAPYYISVLLSNDAGTSAESYAMTYIGPDAPKIGTVTAEYTDGVMTISWPTAEVGEHGGYMLPDQVTYTLTRVETGEVLAKDVTENRYVDNIGEVDDFTMFTYQVVGQFQGVCSEPALSRPMKLGAIVPPYRNQFDNDAAFDNYTVIDANEDTKVWYLHPTLGAAAIDWNGLLDMDDWLITPAVRLRKGLTYLISVDVKCATPQLPENIEVKWGNAPTVEAMTNMLIENTEVSNASEYRTLSAYLTPESDGTYYIGFHGCSPRYRYTLYLTNIDIAAGIGAARPLASTNLKVTPGLYGALEAIVEFNAPTEAFTGEKLENLEKIEVLRDGVAVHTFDNPAPGEALKFTDHPETFGSYRYSVIAYNDYGPGEAAEKDVYVGVNAPAAPTNASFCEQGDVGQILITWDAPTVDCAGYPLRPEDVTYMILSNQGEVTRGVTECQYSYHPVSANDQQFVQISVYGMTQGGLSEDFAYAGMHPVGKAYETPYNESFTDGQLHYILGMEVTVEPASWNIFSDATFNDVASQDGDNGFLAFRGSYDGSQARLFTGKIDLTGLDKPTLRFYSFCMGAEENLNTLDIEVRADGGEYETLRNITMTELGEEQGWHRLETSLEKYAGKTIEIRLTATSRSFTYLLLDHLSIDSPQPRDLSATRLNAPASARTGQPFNVEATIINNGSETVDEYEVNLYRNGDIVATQQCGPLATNGKDIVVFEQTFAVTDPDDNTYWARVRCDGDEKGKDNTSDEIVVRLLQTSYPSVTLSGSRDDNGDVTLAWTAPDLSMSAELVQESFEDAEPWCDNVDGWTFEDHDGLPIGLPANIDWPGLTLGQTKGSFFVFDHLLDYDPQMKPHTGEQMLMCLYAYNMKQIDDWAISPTLSGRSQTVTFFARSYSSEYPETIEVLYRTSADGEFILLDRYERLATEWTEFTADLPEGAVNFAIRSCAEDNFLLFLDDFVFEAAGSGTDLTLEGYNIYRDGKLMSGVGKDVTTFIDTECPDGATYVISAKYDKGESRPSNAVRISPSGIEQIMNEGIPITYYDLMGRRVTKPTGIAIEVKNGNAKKLKFKN